MRISMSTKWHQAKAMETLQDRSKTDEVAGNASTGDRDEQVECEPTTLDSRATTAILDATTFEQLEEARKHSYFLRPATEAMKPQDMTAQR